MTALFTHKISITSPLLVLAWTFTGSHGAYIHVVERLHSTPLGDITITAPTLFFLPFTGGCDFGAVVIKDKEKKEKPEKKRKARTKDLAIKEAFL